MIYSVRCFKLELIDDVYHVDGTPISDSRSQVRRHLKSVGLSTTGLTGCFQLLDWPDVAFVMMERACTVHMKDGRIMREGRWVEE
ncbi:hypothetical protein EVB39_084 [Rhizobium phage RHph_TM3_3_9]|nr:hypothetical protein EVB39_084 [Rhizobium phage RHph_TM3_3_9]QIG68605.1 hypothetical protein EVB66_084 [Rhizobium phage RHph_TM3_3_13]QIG74463.1 hypothetical protein EVC09_083 [Rhizobium phage RHph_TM3_3_10]QXV74577.1 hypothetical protein [Rhizobium phage RHEph19]